MIKFSKKGLMYRLALYGTGFNEWNIAENLCPFLRQCLVGLLLCYFYVCVGVLCGTLMLSFCGTLILWGIFGYSENMFPDFNTFILASSVLFTACLLTLSFWIRELSYRYKRWTYKKLLYKVVTDCELVEQKPSTTYRVIVEWYKSIHDKICPSIDFIE